MSGIKRQMEEEQRYYDIAFDVLLKIGAISTCDIHEDYWYVTDNFDSNSVYAQATNMIRELYGANENELIFKEQISIILKSAGIDKKSCPHCDKFFKD